jgi:hypothetical protein
MAINMAYENSRGIGDAPAPADGSDPRISPQGNVGSSNAYANNAINNANATFGAITTGLREANDANRRRIDSQTAGQEQESRDFEFKSQNFARASLGKIGGFEGTYGIGLQNSIAQRTEKNIQAIKRAGEEAKATGDMELAGRLQELGLQQMTLVAQLNAQAFEQSKFAIQNQREDARFAVQDKQYEEAQKLLGKDFAQLDNGDYGYFDQRTGEFIKQGSAPAPRSGGSTPFSLNQAQIDFYKQDFQNSGLSFADWAYSAGLDDKTRNALAGNMGDYGNRNMNSNAPEDAIGFDSTTGEYILRDDFESKRMEYNFEIAQLRNEQEGVSMATKEYQRIQKKIRELEEDRSALESARFAGQTISQGN